MMEYLYETGTEKFSRNEEGKLQFNSYKIQQVRDEKGLKFEKIPETDFNLEVDVVVIAVGQTVDYSAIDDASGTQLEKSRDKIVIDEISMATNVPGVFAEETLSIVVRILRLLLSLMEEKPPSQLIVI